MWDAWPVWIVVVVLVVVLYWVLQRPSQRSRARNHRAQRAEQRAEGLLQRQGYAVLDRQVRGSWQVHVDGHPVDVGCRADLLVQSKRSGRTYIAEVKSGSLATDMLRHAPTRRQLLEYSLVFDVDGLLLVDMDEEQIHRVRFGAEKKPP